MLKYVVSRLMACLITLLLMHIVNIIYVFSAINFQSNPLNKDSEL